MKQAPDARRAALSELYPEVPIDKRPCELPHSGQFTAGDIEYLESRGWTPVDVRYISGIKQIVLTLNGAIRGTVELSAAQFKALEMAAKLFLNKNMLSGDENKKPTTNVMDVISSMGRKPHNKELDQYPEVVPGHMAEAYKHGGDRTGDSPLTMAREALALMELKKEGKI